MWAYVSEVCVVSLCKFYEQSSSVCFLARGVVVVHFVSKLLVNFTSRLYVVMHEPFLL